MAKPSLVSLSKTVALAALLAGCAGTPPKQAGVHQLQLRDCPSSPNCVSSHEINNEHYISPITTFHQPQVSIEQLKNIVSAHPNMSLIKQSDNYLYVQFTSSVLGFVDDLEFIVEETQIQVRSASRLGYSDFGANRKHIEAVRKQFK